MSKRRGRRDEGGELPREVQVSKKLSWLLRHGAEQEGLKLGPGGYVNLKDVVSHPFYTRQFSFCCCLSGMLPATSLQGNKFRYPMPKIPPHRACFHFMLSTDDAAVD